MTDASDVAGLVHVPVSARAAPLTRNLWWAATGSGDNAGADALVRRCVRRYRWTPEYAGRVRTAYRQFLELRRVLEDWDGGVVAPSAAVEDMWNVHMLDPVNYCHDCALLCGRVLGNCDADGRREEPERRRRLLATRQLLRARYENEVDAEIWGFAASDVDARQELAIDKGSRRPVSEERDASVNEHRQTEVESPVSGDNSSNNESFSSRSFHREASSGLEERDALELKTFAGEFEANSSPIEDFDTEMDKSAFLGFPHVHEEKSGMKKQMGEDAEMLKSDSGRRPDDFDIRIRTLKGQVFSLSVNRKTTIQQIKSMIEEQHGTPKKQQYLLFYGKVLEDRRTVHDYKISPGVGLQLLARSWRQLDATQEESHATIAT